MSDHWGFVTAAYGVTAVALLIYWRRLAAKEREIERLIAERSHAASRAGHPRCEPASRSPLQ